jgi:hypothetical protein
VECGPIEKLLFKVLKSCTIQVVENAVSSVNAKGAMLRFCRYRCNIHAFSVIIFIFIFNVLCELASLTGGVDGNTGT